MLLGYTRVSTADQNPDHQVDALRRAGVAEKDIYVDHASGAKASRPRLDELLHLLRDGDTLKITRLDRAVAFMGLKAVKEVAIASSLSELELPVAPQELPAILARVREHAVETKRAVTADTLRTIWADVHTAALEPCP